MAFLCYCGVSDLIHTCVTTIVGCNCGWWDVWEISASAAKLTCHYCDLCHYKSSVLYKWSVLCNQSLTVPAGYIALMIVMLIETMLTRRKRKKKEREKEREREGVTICGHSIGHGFHQNRE